MGEARGYFVAGWGPGAIGVEAEAVCLRQSRRSRCTQGRAFQVFFVFLCCGPWLKLHQLKINCTNAESLLVLREFKCPHDAIAHQECRVADDQVGIKVPHPSLTWGRGMESMNRKVRGKKGESEQNIHVITFV